MGYDVAKLAHRQHTAEVERQQDQSTTSNGILNDSSLLPFKPVNYFYLLSMQKHRRPLTLTQLNALPPAAQQVLKDTVLPM